MPLGGRLAAVYRTLAIVVLNTLVLVVACESGLRCAQERARDHATRKSTADWVSLPYYRGQPWAARFWEESSRALHGIYAPWVLWRNEPFDGELIHVDGSGMRQTPGSECRPGAFTVVGLGGSTMWGIGSPDQGTIPAALARELRSRRGESVCVRNFGENGYVSTQGLIRLIVLLRQGPPPDVVISYDGVNDVYAAYQSGRAGVHENLQQIQTLMDQGSEDSWLALARRLQIVQLLGQAISPPSVLTYKTLGVSANTLAQEVVDTYLANIQMLEALASRYGFIYVAFWQPTLFTGHKPLTAQEQFFIDHTDPALVELYRVTYGAIVSRHAEFPHLYDLRDIFDGKSQDLWIDNMSHVTPPANDLIARRMADLLPVRGGARTPAPGEATARPSSPAEPSNRN